MSDRFEICIKCGGGMVVVLAVNPVTHECEKCGHREYSLIDAMPPAPAPEERVLVDVFCISAGEFFTKHEMLAIKKIHPTLKGKGNLEIIHMLSGKSEFIVGTMPKYQSAGVAEEYGACSLSIEAREKNA